MRAFRSIVVVAALACAARGATGQVTQPPADAPRVSLGYRYFAGFGVRYGFGSIFNNVVNPRFGEGGGGGIIFF